MKLSPMKKLLIGLTIGLIALAVATQSIGLGEDGMALLAGYAIFSVNFLLLTKIYSGLVVVSQTGHSSPRLKTWLLLGSALKFVGLIAALYSLIVWAKFSGLYLALGALLSLVLLTAILLSSYLRSFSVPSQR